MIVKSVRVDAEGRVHVTLTNNKGVAFESARAVRDAAKDAMQRIGLEGRAAIALVRAAKPRDIEGTDLRNIVREEQ